MKKLLTTAAVCGLVIAAAPAHADVQLDLGGWFKGYGVFVDNDDAAGTETRDFDFVRHTEVHFGGETTLDNGLTVGFHIESEADENDSFDVEESYAYFSGSWGRINAGAEDGAGYLLQVEAPSADSNYDGIRQFVNPFNFGATDVAGVYTAPIDYAMDVSSYSDKLTYLSPILNGFQFGASYTPDNTTAPSSASDFGGTRLDDVADARGSVYEGAVRYEGMYNDVGVIAGLGYVHENLEQDGTLTDDRAAWNAGLDLDFGPIGVGGSYKNDDFNDADEDEHTWVVGVDYTTGPFKLGASYMAIENFAGVDNDDLDRWTGGVVYTYGPGMTFRGSVTQVDAEDDSASTDADGTAVMLGTQINF